MTIFLGGKISKSPLKYFGFRSTSVFFFHPVNVNIQKLKSHHSSDTTKNYCFHKKKYNYLSNTQRKNIKKRQNKKSSLFYFSYDMFLNVFFCMFSLFRWFFTILFVSSCFSVQGLWFFSWLVSLSKCYACSTD